MANLYKHEQWRKVMEKLEDSKEFYGYVPSPPDPRDFQFKAFAGTEALPEAFIRKAEMSPVRDQGKFGTCVGHAAWAIKEWQENQQQNTPQGGLSPRFIYQMAKQIDGIPNTPGTYPRIAFKVMQDYGDCPESVFPYSEMYRDYNLPRPPDNVIKAAEPYKISAYAQINTLDELKRAVIEQGPVMIGVMVTDSFVYTSRMSNGTVYIPKPEGFLRGGHAITIVGYDNNIQLGKYKGGVLMMNSWGTSWGDKGFAWIPYAAWTEPWWIDMDHGIPFVLEMWASVDLPYTLKAAKQILLKIGSKTAYVDGQAVTLDVPPKIENGRTLLPVRFVTENVGYIVNWQPQTRVVELRRPY